MARIFDSAQHRLAAGWVIGLAALLLTPIPAPPPPGWVPAFLDQSGDKLAHAALFFGATRAFLRSARVLGLERPVLAAAAAAIAYGGGLELLQGFVGRDSSWGDLVADALGACLASAPLPTWWRVPR